LSNPQGLVKNGQRPELPVSPISRPFVVVSFQLVWSATVLTATATQNARLHQRVIELFFRAYRSTPTKCWTRNYKLFLCRPIKRSDTITF